MLTISLMEHVCVCVPAYSHIGMLATTSKTKFKHGKPNYYFNYAPFPVYKIWLCAIIDDSISTIPNIPAIEASYYC